MIMLIEEMILNFFFVLETLNKLLIFLKNFYLRWTIRFSLDC